MFLKSLKKRNYSNISYHHQVLKNIVEMMAGPKMNALDILRLGNDGEVGTKEFLKEWTGFNSRC